METQEKTEIRDAVRQRYGQIAKNETAKSEKSQAVSCCSLSNAIANAMPAASCCGGPELTAEQISTVMGYSKEDIASVIEGANLGLGCGNPVALASLKPGETVVDLGSGGGFDCFLAAKQVVESGKVIGVDMTPEMITKARKNAEKMGTKNVEFRLGEIEHLPVADDSADLIMSNCVINLSPDKLQVYREAYRILKPGGRLSISDVLATTALPANVRNNLELVAACIGGAVTFDDTRKMLKEAGFQNIKITAHDKSRDLTRAWDPEKSDNALDYVVSAYIEAVKPA
ncbi:MAG: arsenite methyltransferase [Desulfobacterales bacterium]|jgi:SAM-dependent methyltransferase